MTPTCAPRDRDLALDRAMIPLGSCTMKLNARQRKCCRSPGRSFRKIHPFVPTDQALGYQHLIEDLSQKLCAITGYDAISMQPTRVPKVNSRSARDPRYHIANGNAHRDVCLIPTSAHGTNPASAQMAGMKVVVVKVSDARRIDMDDFRAKAEQYADSLSCCMITYPSTHGVFEENVPRGLRGRA